MSLTAETAGKAGLKSELGLIPAMSIVVGVVLGAGAFMKPPAVLGAAGDSTTALLAWILGGLFSAAGGLTLCELGAMFPRTGGVYVYLEEVFGERTAFLYGWMIVFLFGPATVGALTGYFSSIFCLIFEISTPYIPVVAAGVLSFVAVVNCISVKTAGRVQTLATACKLIPIVLLTIFGIWKGNGQILAVTSTVGAAATSFSVAVLATLFAYDGWAQVASLGGEIKNPAKILPRAIIGGLAFLVIVYVSINIALLKVIPADQMVSLGHDASAIAAQKLFGIMGGNLISVGIMIAMIGGLNGYTMTLSRILYTMGVRGQMPGARIWGKIDESSSTPVASILFLLVISFFYSRMFDADKLSNIASFSNWIFYMLTFVAVFVARRTHAHIPRPYRVPLYPFIPLFAIGGAFYVFYGMLSTQPWNGALSIALTLAGLPVYWYMKSDHAPRPGVPRFKAKYVVTVASLVILASLTVSVRMLDLRPELRVATEPSLVPFAYYEKGHLSGFDIELMNELARKAGFKAVYVPIPFDNIMDALRNRNVDAAIASISVTEERRKIVVFGQPYLSDAGLALLVGKSTAIGDVSDLAGKKVGVFKGSTAESYAAKLAHAHVYGFIGKSDLIMAFNLGALDVLIDDLPVLEYQLAQGVFPNGRIAAVLNREEYAIAFNPARGELKEPFNKALNNMKKSGELDALYQKWSLGRAIAAPPPHSP
ncbi:MAG TPA: amino acid permease [Syntrophales bacterium]|mgnify:FL=1|nr:amino acid permease [Syntrophales bacterium]